MGAWLVEVLGSGVGCPTVSGVGMADRDAPRWKGLVIDGLSYLLFVLLIPSGHPLRKLYAAFD